MKQILYAVSALALVSTLSACGKQEAANNVAAENATNAMMADSNNMNDMSGHDMNNMSDMNMNMNNMSDHDMNKM